MSSDTNLASYSVPIRPNTSIEGIFLYAGQKPEPKVPLITDEEILELQSAH